MIREFVQTVDDREWQSSLFSLLQSQTYNQCEVDLFELMCKVLDQNLFSQVDWARNTIFFKDLKVNVNIILEHVRLRCIAVFSEHYYYDHKRSDGSLKMTVACCITRKKRWGEKKARIWPIPKHFHSDSLRHNQTHTFEVEYFIVLHTTQKNSFRFRLKRYDWPTCQIELNWVN